MLPRLAVIAFFFFLTKIQAKRVPNKCKSHFIVTQSSNTAINVLGGTDNSNTGANEGFPNIFSWYIGSYLNGYLPSNDICVSQRPPAISSASCVLEGFSSEFPFDDDRFPNELLDDAFPVVFNCDGTILINQLPNGAKITEGECYGAITWQGPLGSSQNPTTVAITGVFGDYKGASGQMIITNVLDSAQCPCYASNTVGLPPCYKYELFLVDSVQGTNYSLSLFLINTLTYINT